MSPMNPYYERTIKGAGTMFARWRCGSAEMAELTISHKSLRIVVKHPGKNGKLIIACIGPSWISGPTQWEACDIVFGIIQETAERPTAFVVSDPAVGLEIRCDSLEVKEYEAE